MSVKKIVIGVFAALAVLIGGILLVAAMQPTDFLVTRSTSMAAPPARVFQQVNNFHAWEAWSPWAKLDPNAKAFFEGPESGVGAQFTWSGNDKVGEGTQTIVESKPDERIEIRLDFKRPMEDTSDVEFLFKPDGDKTNVIWNMRGKKNFVSKVFCLFMNMDKMVGGDFEKGLASLKATVEKPVEKPAEGEAAKSEPTASEPAKHEAAASAEDKKETEK